MSAVRTFQRFDARCCSQCGKPLSVHEEAAGSTCSSLACQAKGTIARRERDRGLMIKEAERRASQSARRLAIDPKRIALAILPVNTARAVPTLPTHAAKFRKYIAELIDKVFAMPMDAEEGEDVQRDDGAAPPPAHHELLTLGCATCKGRCCYQGTTDAFLGEKAIKRYRRDHPEATAESALEDYLSRLPEETYLHSCVYHAEGGCTLPREMRATICNAWFCAGLHELRETLDDVDDPVVFAVAASGARVYRESVYTGDGFRRFEECVDDDPDVA